MTRRNLKQKTRIFWGWEGHSERNYGGYLQLMADHLDLGLHFDREHNLIGGGDPLRVIESCAKACEHREKARGAFKHRVVLMDSDCWGQNNARDANALQICKKSKLTLILQNTDHESFLLRHHKDEMYARPPVGQAMRALKKLWPDYEKPCPARVIFDRFSVRPLDHLDKVEKDFSTFLRLIGFKCPP